MPIEYTGQDPADVLAQEQDRIANGGDPAAAPARVKEIQFLIQNASKYGYVMDGNVFRPGP
jgi:hypothetical protein